MVIDNNEVRRRGASLLECQEWKERPGFAQEKSSTGHSCNPWTKPLLSSFRFRVDGWRWMVIPVACTAGNGFSKLVNRLMLRKMLGPPVTANRDVFSWKLEKRRPGMGNVRRENEREPVLNIERGLNSKISLRTVHWARSLQAPAFERERWVLRDRNIYLRTCEWKRERGNVSGKERDREKAKRERRRKSERRWKKAKESGGKGEKLPFLLDPEIHGENNVSGLTRRPWPLTCSFR